MAEFKVVLTDQVFPSIELEQGMLGGIDATLDVADGSETDVLARSRNADALLTTYFPISAETIATLERCKIVARYGIGVDNVDIAAANAHGIVVTNVPDYSVQEVAAHALALGLGLLRRTYQADAYVRGGGWVVNELRPIRRISTLTAGLVGFGRIARQLASSLDALGMRVIVYDPYVPASEDGPELVSLEELLGQADLVSLHAPLTPETTSLIGAEQLHAMKDSAVLVNTSRGPLIDVDALLQALRDGTIAGAGLDVFDVEPVDVARLEGVPNLVVSPHMAYYSEEALQESQRKATTQIIKVLSGQEPDYPVSP